MKAFGKLLLSALVPVALVACGDDVTNTDVTDATGVKTVAGLDAADKCDSSALGELLLNTEDGGLYVCNGRKWVLTAGESAGETGCELNSVTVDGVDGVEIVCGAVKDTLLNGAKGSKGGQGDPGAPGASGAVCSARAIDGVGVEITCDGAVIDTLKNAANGDPGDDGTVCSARKIDGVGIELICDDGAIVDTLKNGAPGEAGTSCTAEPYDDGVETGVVVSCGGVAVDTILNGAKGAPGDAGASCTGRALDGVGIEISCGDVVIDTLKNDASNTAFCGENIYNTDNQFCDDRDKKVYKRVQIGNQVWMAENLNYDDSVSTPSLLGKSWCYNNEPDSCARYGRLYTWAAAMDSVETGCGNGKVCAASAGRVRGICPDGWHLPDSVEVEELYDAVGGQSTAGTMLKTTEGWFKEQSSAIDGNGLDAYGFSALPAGYRQDGYFDLAHIYAHFWCTTESLADKACHIELRNHAERASLFSWLKANGYSVRCVKD